MKKLNDIVKDIGKGNMSKLMQVNIVMSANNLKKSDIAEACGVFRPSVSLTLSNAIEYGKLPKKGTKQYKVINFFKKLGVDL